MPSTASGYYNNPEIGQAFSSLASMFSPPSGTEMAGYALANSRKAEADRLGALFNYAKDPNFNKDEFDRLGVASGRWTPNTGYYGVDSEAATSRANNANTVKGGLLGQLYQPLNQGQVRPELPADVAGTVGLPALGAVEGAPKPLSETEAKGAILRGLPQADQNAAVLSEIPVESVITGSGPQILRRSDAVGKAPYSADNGTLVEGVASVGGKNVPVFRAKNGTTYQTADGQLVPPDIQVFEKARPTGTSAEVGMRNTEAGDKAGMFYNRAAPASQNIDNQIAAGYVPSDADYEAILGSISGAPNALTRHVISDEGRKFYTNAQNFMMTVLRPDTGAAFGKDEFQSYARIFIPMPGDTSDLVQQKAVARATALAALQGTSHGAAEKIAGILKDNGLAIPPEMAAVIARGGIGAKGTTPAPAAPGAPPALPLAAVVALRQHPERAAEFDAKFGPGAAASVLNGGK